MRLPILASACLVLCISGCSSSTKAKPAGSGVENPLNDAAKFLAGVPGRPGGAFATFEREEAWKTHSAEMEKLWSDFEHSYLGPARAFQKREMAPVVRYSETVFYPFSGPDVPFLMTFFPSGSTYIMAGLEPVGPIPEPAHFTPEMLDRYLSGLRFAASEMFGRSFFRTSEMDRQFRGQIARGLLPVIFMLLTRSGCEIENARHVQITPDGVVQPAPDNGKPRGVEIEIRRPDGATARLYYFSTDLAKGLETDPRFLRFLDHSGAPDTFVKSGSFLLHWRMCQRLRKYILEKSRLVLQDDTGVPFRYFVAAGWNVRLFGEYAVPESPFRKQFQPDLAAAFEEPGRAKPLGFSLGYGARKRPTALILAVRPDSPTTAQSDSSPQPPARR